MFKRLLVPVDGGELDARAVSQSIELARQLGAAITGFIAEPQAPIPTESINPITYSHTVNAHAARGAEHAHKVLAHFEQQAAAAGVAFAGLSQQSDDIGQAISDAAVQQGCDMIVMVTHGRSRLGELFLGSCTKQVLARSGLPVLVLH